MDVGVKGLFIRYTARPYKHAVNKHQHHLRTKPSSWNIIQDYTTRTHHHQPSHFLAK